MKSAKKSLITWAGFVLYSTHRSAVSSSTSSNIGTRKSSPPCHQQPTCLQRANGFLHLQLGFASFLLHFFCFFSSPCKCSLSLLWSGSRPICSHIFLHRVEIKFYKSVLLKQQNVWGTILDSERGISTEVLKILKC